jgi:uncharacterized Zn finger protein
MSNNRYYSPFPPYVPVAERRRQAEAKAKKMAKKGIIFAPIIITGRTIANTFWGKQWCDNLEAYSDFSNRLPRGRTYVRHGAVIDLQITSGTVTAQVQGSSLYTVTINILPLPTQAWKNFKDRCSGKISSLLDLLQGRLDKGVLQEITQRPGGLFPSPKEIKLNCSCPDGAIMCKHVAAVLYGVGARLDTQPELFFSLRHTDMQELITSASQQAATTSTSTPSSAALADDDLSAIFGIEIETISPTPIAHTPTPTTPAIKKTATKTSRTPQLPAKPAKTAKPAKPAKSAKTAKPIIDEDVEAEIEAIIEAATMAAQKATTKAGRAAAIEAAIEAALEDSLQTGPSSKPAARPGAVSKKSVGLRASATKPTPRAKR